jgi:hypothetical protein
MKKNTTASLLSKEEGCDLGKIADIVATFSILKQAAPRHQRPL